MNEFLSKIDKLFEGSMSDQHEAYVALKTNKEKVLVITSCLAWKYCGWDDHDNYYFSCPIHMNSGGDFPKRHIWKPRQLDRDKIRSFKKHY